tara:strand:- start:783 stop:1070 length:288 start_codon:yes stop_codon:yes gene_type:complete
MDCSCGSIRDTSTPISAAPISREGGTFATATAAGMIARPWQEIQFEIKRVIRNKDTTIMIMMTTMTEVRITEDEKDEKGDGDVDDNKNDGHESSS